MITTRRNNVTPYTCRRTAWAASVGHPLPAGTRPSADAPRMRAADHAGGAGSRRPNGIKWRWWCARLTGQEQEVEVLCGKGNNQTMPLPEPCGRSREGTGEASAGAHVGRAIERRNLHCSECRGRHHSRRQHCSDRFGEVREGSAASKNPRTHVRSRPGPLMLKGMVRRGKALFFSGCEARPATVAPAGSSRSGSWR